MTCWGRHTTADTDAALMLLDIDLAPNIAPTYRVISDGSRLTGVDFTAFGRLAYEVGRRVGRYNRRVERHALVAPMGLYGAVVAGFFPMLGVEHAYRAFGDRSDAYDWVGATDVQREVERIVSEVRREPPFLRRVRAELERSGKSARLSTLAQALGESERTLQRRLLSLGTSFRDELQRARIERGRRLLIDTDDKLESIAREVGFASASHFVAAFRSAVGETPHQFRQRLR